MKHHMFVRTLLWYQFTYHVVIKTTRNNVSCGQELVNARVHLNRLDNCNVPGSTACASLGYRILK
jgi:hypothetical protein